MWKPIANAFCPTGEGNGQDNSCPPGGGGSEERSLLSEDYVSKVAVTLVKKYPGLSETSTPVNMGSTLLFRTDTKVEEVRKWLDTTKFKKVSARKYAMDLPDGIRTEAEIDKSTYGYYAILLTATRKT